MFRRRRRGKPDDEIGPDSTADSTADEVSDEDGAEGGAEDPGDVAAVPAAAGVAPEPAGLTPRPDGPWDVTEVAEAGAERFDLGGVRLAIPDGAQVQLDVTPEGMVVPTVFVGSGAVQISAFAAPRRTGIWAEVRTEIAESLAESGGEVAEADGTFGTELHGQVPVQLEDGSVGLQPARFVGVDGPRWFLRGLFTGAAVVPGAVGGLEDVFRGTVVVRGSDAMAPRDPLPLTVPREIVEAAEAPDDRPESESPPPLAPFERGPEITEVR